MATTFGCRTSSSPTAGSSSNTSTAANAGLPAASAVEEGALRDEAGARGVGEQRARRHGSEVVAGDEAAGLRGKRDVQRDDVGAREQAPLRGREVVPGSRGRDPRRLPTPDEDVHAEGDAVAGDEAADPAEAEDAERPSAEDMAERALRPLEAVALPLPRLQPRGVLRQASSGREHERPGQLGRRHRASRRR